MTGPLSNIDLAGAWFSLFITLCVLSFLYDDNPFYKLAEHLFIGTSLGIIVTEQLTAVLKPNLYDKLVHEGRFSYAIVAVLTLLLFAKLIPGKGWLAQFPIAFVVGIYAGRSIPAVAGADLLTQVQSTMVDLGHGSLLAIAGRIFMLVGTVTALVYFYFSKAHTGVLGVASRIGVVVLMLAFGASFGYTVQGRIALLVGRFQEILGLDRPAAEAAQVHAPLLSAIFAVLIVTALWMRHRRRA